MRRMPGHCYSRTTPKEGARVYNGVPYVIDTGYGVTFKLMAGVPLARLRYVFITHHHSDHNLELGPLLSVAASGLSSR